MTLGQLRYFVAVADAGSFTRAAAQMHVSQPSLSQQIRALESELGGELVERHANGIRLTEAGAAFLVQARDSIRAADQARDAAQEALKTVPRRIEIATVRSLAMTVLPDSIERWYTRYPEFVITLREFSSSRSTERAVLTGNRLLGIGPKPTAWRGAIRSLGWDELVVILPSGGPELLPDEPVELSSLAEAGWVLYEPSHGLRSMIDSACSRCGFTPQRTAETGQIETAARLAAAGLGVALVPRHTVPYDLRGAAHPIHPPVVWEIAAYARSAWPSFVDEYLDTFEQSPLRPGPRDDALIVSAG
jgi:DNA-binding transcriptional LysR family regulator